MATTSKWMHTVIALAVIVAACSSDTSPLTLDEYVDALQAVETDFVEGTPNPAENPSDRNQCAVGVVRTGRCAHMCTHTA